MSQKKRGDSLRNNLEVEEEDGLFFERIETGNIDQASEMAYILSRKMVNLSNIYMIITVCESTSSNQFMFCSSN